MQYQRQESLIDIDGAKNRNSKSPSRALPESTCAPPMEKLPQIW